MQSDRRNSDQRPRTSTDGDPGPHRRQAGDHEEKKQGNLDARGQYNDQRVLGRMGRELAKTAPLRHFNNWVKSILIQKYSKMVKDDFMSRQGRELRLSVLELACGKGGDLFKWSRANIENYVGVDIAGNSLSEAFERWKEHVNDEKTAKKAKYPALFYERDMSLAHDEFWKDLAPDMYFDMVSCQFSMHYCWESEEKANNFLSNVAAKLCKEGYFIATTTDSNAIVKRLRNDGVKRQGESDCVEYVHENEFYSMRRYGSLDFPVSQPFGLRLGFWLDDEAVGQTTIEAGQAKRVYVDEFMIYKERLIELAAANGLQLEESMNFHKFYEKYVSVDDHRKLLIKMMKWDGQAGESTEIPQEQWDIIGLYQVLAFRKVSGPEMKSVARRYGDPNQKRNRVFLLNKEAPVVGRKFQ